MSRFEIRCWLNDRKAFAGRVLLVSAVYLIAAGIWWIAPSVISGGCE